MNKFGLIFSKIGTGLLYGIGFFIVMAIFMWGSTFYFENKREEMLYGDAESGECKDYKRCMESSGLVLGVTSERITEEEFVLFGNIRNEGNTEWTTVDVQAELFDEEGNYIDECKSYVDKRVFPGETTNFKLDCSKCSTVNLENYHSYKVSITDANTY